MGRRRKGVYKQQRESRDYNYLNSPLIHELYPGIESIRMHLEFSDMDMQGNPEPADFTYEPNSKAHFERPCPYRECINGGFDLSQGISHAVRSNQEITGELTCQGWQDSERINKHRCLLKCEYRISVTLREAKGDQAPP